MVERIARRPEDRIAGLPVGSPWRGVGLSEDPRAGRAQARDRHGVCGRYVVTELLYPGGGAQALRLKGVLHGHRQAMQRAENSSSCQCTIPSSDSRRVVPGESLDLMAEITLKKSGLQKASITLFLDGNRKQRLWVSAVGKRKLPLVYLGDHIELLMGLPKNMAVRCEIYQSKKEPAPLHVRSTRGVSANFKKWKIIEFYDEKWQNPAVFEAELIVTRNVMDLQENATIAVSIDGENWLSVPVNRTDLKQQSVTTEDMPPPG